MTYGATVTPLDLAALFDLKGEPDDFAGALESLDLTFPREANRASRAGERELYWIGPDHWLLRAPLAEELELQARLKDAVGAEHASVILVSDTLAGFALRGADARQILAIACPLDTDAAIFPFDGVTYSEAFGLKALVVRRDHGFDLFADRSFGPMLEDYFSRAIGS